MTDSQPIQPTQPKRFPVVPLACCVLVVVTALAFSRPRTTPAAPDAPAVELDPRGPDMSEVFTGDEARGHALQFAAICDRASATLLADAQRGDKTRIKSGVDLAKYRDDLRWYTTDGWSFASRYPRLKDAVSTYLDKSAGTSPKEMDDVTRRKWADALAVLANNSRHAAGRVK